MLSANNRRFRHVLCEAGRHSAVPCMRLPPQRAVGTPFPPTTSPPPPLHPPPIKQFGYDVRVPGRVRPVSVRIARGTLSSTVFERFRARFCNLAATTGAARGLERACSTATCPISVQLDVFHACPASWGLALPRIMYHIWTRCFFFRQFPACGRQVEPRNQVFFSRAVPPGASRHPSTARMRSMDFVPMARFVAHRRRPNFPAAVSNRCSAGMGGCGWVATWIFPFTISPRPGNRSPVVAPRFCRLSASSRIPGQGRQHARPASSAGPAALCRQIRMSLFHRRRNPVPGSGAPGGSTRAGPKKKGSTGNVPPSPGTGCLPREKPCRGPCCPSAPLFDPQGAILSSTRYSIKWTPRGSCTESTLRHKRPRDGSWAIRHPPKSASREG